MMKKREKLLKEKDMENILFIVVVSDERKKQQIF